MARVYVSSTVNDLRSERDAVINWLVAAGHQPVHSYRPDSETVRDSCLNDVDKCDFYVLILGHRYGFQPSQGNPDNLSITHLEFRRAASIPRIALIQMSVPDIRRTDLQDLVKAGMLRAFQDEVRAAVRAFEFFDLHDLIQGLSTGLLDEVSRREKTEREIRLGAMLIDHTGFINDRLRRFVGREKELKDLTEIITAKRETGGYVTITGAAGQGKSCIIAKLADLLSTERPVVHIIPFNPGPDHQVNLLRDVMAQMILKHHLPEVYVASETRTVLRQSLPRVLEEIASRRLTETLFIDGLDQIQDETRGGRDLSFLPLKLPAGIVGIVGTRPNDTLRPLELLQPHVEYKLPPLSEGDFTLLLRRHGVTLAPEAVHRFYVGVQAHALYLDLVSQELAVGSSEEMTQLLARLSANPGSVFSLAINRLALARDEWNAVIKPVLGVLAAAKESLSGVALRDIINVDGHELREGLLRLGGLVSQDTRSRYQLFHLKFYDYLRSESQATTDATLFDAYDIATWHRRIMYWCMPETDNLLGFWSQPAGEPREQERRSYALDHLASHLYAAQERERLWALLDNAGYARAKLWADPSTRTFVRDLDLGCRALESAEYTPERRMQTTSRLWKYSLMRTTLASSIREYPEQMYTLLVVRGRYANALEIVEEFSDVTAQARALYRIAQALSFVQPHSEDVLPILLRARDAALRIPDPWQQADTLVSIAGELATCGNWAEADTTANRIGSSTRKILALNSVLEAMACAGERQFFCEHAVAVHRLAGFCGVRWEGEEVYKAMESLLAQPERAPELLGSIDATSEGIRAAKALISVSPELLLRRLSVDMEGSPAKPLRRVYACVVREVCKTKPNLAALVNWDCLRTRTDDSLDDLIERALLLSLGPLSSSASAVLTRSLSLTPILSDGRARAEALLGLDEDIRDLCGTLSDEKDDYLLSAAVRIARAAQPQSSRYELLHKLASAYVRLGRNDEAGRLEVEAGGGPLVRYGEEDLQVQFTRLAKERNIEQAFNLRRSDRYFQQLLDRLDWNGALELIREMEFPREDADELVRLSKRADDCRLTGDERIRFEELESTSKSYENNTEACAIRMAKVARGMMANGESQTARSLLSQAVTYMHRVRSMSGKIRALDEVYAAAVDTQARDIACQCEVELLELSRLHATYSDRVSIVGRVIDGMIKLGYEARARRVLDLELTEDLSRASDHRERCILLRVLAKSRRRLGDLSSCIELIYQEWGNAASAEHLLQLLPLASTVAAFDSVQRSELVSLVVHTEPLQLGVS
jgi:hypothetical protein